MKKKLLLRLSLLISILIIIGGLISSPYLYFDNERWLPHDNINQQHLDLLKSEFESNNDLIIGFRLKDSFFKPNTIRLFKELATSFEKIDHINHIRSPLEATVVHSYGDSLYTETYQQALDEKRFTLNQFKQNLISSDYYGQYISKDYKTAIFILKINDKSDGLNHFRKKQVVNAVTAILSKKAPQRDYFFVGNGYLTYHMDSSTRKNIFYLVPIVFVMVLLTLRISLQSWLKTCIIGLAMTVSLLQVVIWLTALSFPLTIINVSIPILILVIAIADSIHILNRWEHLYRSNPNKKNPNTMNTILLETFKQTWLPCLITTLTTSIGFGCFVLSNILPLHQFGIASFLIILSAYVIIMGTTIGLIGLFEKSLGNSIIQNTTLKQLNKTNTFWLGTQLYQWVKQYPKKILYSSLLMGLILGLGLLMSFTQTNFIDVFYKKSSKIQQDFAYVDNQLSGTGSIDILLTNQPETYKQIDKFEETQHVIAKITQHPKILNSQTYLNPVSMIHRVFNINNTKLPTSEEELAQELMFLEFSRSDQKNDVLSNYVNFDYSMNRFRIQTKNISSQYINELIRYINNQLKDLSESNIIITGQHVLSHVLSHQVLQTQWITICATFIIVWILFICLFGIRLGSIGMIPNIVPMLMTLGLISWLQIPFDFATVLIASIALGLCVDDSIHFLHYYHHNKKKYGNKEKAIKETILILEKPLVMTSILLTIGFGVFIFSDLVILIKLGAFTLYAITLAYLADMLTLPAALWLWDKEKK
ncbi:hypothetical protein DID75_04605 [Candidatus Marinamargulisbacteria bacterium SCGC AG-410-N11]|nr:hypothetical protein DID75_04605 [Candidatus Marinamargulisbacteria bacterium SCGC AG-410-N11]